MDLSDYQETLIGTYQLTDYPELGERKNTGKNKISLLSPYALEEIAKVLTFGAEKYEAYNWEKGLSYRETLDSLLRHTLAVMKGEDIDPESNLTHLAHMGCNIMFLLHFTATGRTELDDRHKFCVQPKQD